MNVAAIERAEFAPPPQGGFGRAFGLALAAHLLLILALTWGLRWKNEPQDLAVQAELWSPTVQRAAPKAAPRAPAPQVEPPPPPAAPPQPRPEPALKPPPLQVDEQAQRDADIALARKKQEEARQAAAQREQARREREKKEQAEQERRELAQKKAAEEQKRKQDELRKLAAKKQAEEAEQRRQAAAEAKKKAEAQKRAEAEAERKAEAQAKARAAAQARAAEDARHKANVARSLAMAGSADSEGGSAAGKGRGGGSAGGQDERDAGPSGNYAGRIRAAVRPNIVFTDDAPGNPVAEVEVRTDQVGNIISRRITRSSGVRTWDDAVLRALDRTEKLPSDNGRYWNPMLITFRLRD